MDKNTKTVLAFSIGVALGAALGVLYAPDSGKNTREKLAYRLSKYRDQLKKIVDDFLASKHVEPVTAAKSESQKLINETKEKAEKLLGDVEQMINQILNKK